VPERTGLAVRQVMIPPRLVLAGIVVVAILLRWSLFSIESGDYRAFVDPWYRHLAENGGFAALGDTFSNYNTPYLVLLAAATYLPIPELVAIKSRLALGLPTHKAGPADRSLGVSRPDQQRLRDTWWRHRWGRWRCRSTRSGLGTRPGLRSRRRRTRRNAWRRARRVQPDRWL
jgi:hypothetical protein